MATSYPDNIDSFPSVSPTGPLNVPPHDQQHNNANDAIVALQTELGTNPSGSEADVKARFEKIQFEISSRFDQIAFDEIVADETRDSDVYGDLATVGPIATVEVHSSGLLEVSIRSRAEGTNASGFYFTSFELSGANILSADDVNAINSRGIAHTFGATYLLDNLNPGVTTVTMRYRATAGTGTWRRRGLIVKAL